MLLGNDEQFLLKSEQIYSQLCHLFQLEHRRILLVLENILEQLHQQLLSQFPWLATLAQLPSYEQIKVVPLNQLRPVYLEHMVQLQQVVATYQLQHEDSMIALCCSYLHQHIAQDCTMDDLAEHLQMNKDYFGKVFKQKTGLTFHEYSLSLKMEVNSHVG